MVVERKTQSGQSVIEFLLMLPLLVGFTLILIKVNTAIQMSIVDQQYARAQALFLTYNSPIYPELRLRVPFFDAEGQNRLVTGVSEESTLAIDANFQPSASIENIARKGRPGSDDPGEVESRSRVRIRNTVALCTQANVVAQGGGNGTVPILPATPSNVSTQVTVAGTYALNEGTRFDFCRSADEQ